MKLIIRKYSLLLFLCFPLFIFGQADSTGQQVEQQVIAKEKETERTDGKVVKKIENELEDVAGSWKQKISKFITFKRIRLILFSIFALLISLWVTSWVLDNAAKRFNRYRLRILQIKPIIRVFLWSLTIGVIILELFDQNEQQLFALLASSGLALGFAAQDILKNIFGGLMIIFDRPFQIGDRININGNYGEVKNIGFRTTQINTLDDSLVTVPNSMIVSDSVSNANSGALDCMVVVNLWLPIDINVEKVRKVAFEAAITSRFLNIDKPVNILFFDHFDKEPATNVKVKAYVLDAVYEKAFEGDVTEAAKKAFKEIGIYG